MCNDEHDCCGCGCRGKNVVTVPLNGSDVKSEIIAFFTAEEINYVALQPIGEGDVLIFRYTESDETLELEKIQSDVEYDRAEGALFALFAENL